MMVACWSMGGRRRLEELALGSHSYRSAGYWENKEKREEHERGQRELSRCNERVKCVVTKKRTKKEVRN